MASRWHWWSCLRWRRTGEKLNEGNGLLYKSILTVVRTVALGQDAPPQPEVTRALLQAKTVYILSGHVRYYKTKRVLKEGTG
jgi:hypothetical protein